MVYGAFPEDLMQKAYQKLIVGPLADSNLSDIAEAVCADLDRLLVEKIWPAEKEEKQRKQAAEMARPRKANPRGTDRR